MTEPITLTDPATGKTWTSGKRGRKPKFVMDLEAAGTVIPRKAPVATSKFDAQVVPAVPGQLRIWKWIGQAGEEGNDEHVQGHARCLIVAADPISGITHANLTFKHPISGSEFAVCWKELDQDLIPPLAEFIDVTKPGIWQSDGTKWVIRPRLVA